MGIDELSVCPSHPTKLDWAPGLWYTYVFISSSRTLHPSLLPCSTYCCLLIVPCGLPTVSVGLVIIKVFFGTPYTFYPASHHRFNLNLDAKAVSWLQFLNVALPNLRRVKSRKLIIWILVLHMFCLPLEKTKSN